MTLEHGFKKTALILGLASMSPLVGCSVPDDSPPTLAVHTTHESAAANTPLELSGDNLAFLADEATTGPTGTDLNGDGDTLDSVAFAVNTATDAETPIGVQAENILWLGNELYLVSSESKDGRHWDGNVNMTDLVLLHWSPSTLSTEFVDSVADDPNPSAPTPRMITATSNLYYVSGGPAPSGANTSTINVVNSSSPLTHTPVMTDDPTGTLAPCILTQNGNLLFLALNEVTEARDLNGDTDMMDQYVLALLDGTTTTSVIHNTGLAMSNGNGPFRAQQTGAPSDWQVGFLVSEAAQGNTNFNNYTVPAAQLTASWLPTQCLNSQNNETTDDVLFYILYASWVSDPVANPPRNTGLVGSQTIAIANGFIATITPEEEDGCDLNVNGETTDNIVRWTQLVSGALTPILPLNDPNNLWALFDVPGGTHGLTELAQGSAGVFVIEASESASNKDINGDMFKNLNLLGSLSPSNSSAPWDFTGGTSNNAYASASWLGTQPNQSNLDVALLEVVNHVTLNPGGDDDTLDSVPTFATFSGSNIIFPGVAVAVQENNAGIASANNFGFFRVDEAADNRDWDGDGDKLDIVLMRVSFQQSTTAVMGSLVSTLTGPVIPILFNTQPNGGAFVFNESSDNQAGAAGTDVNQDGSIHPFVAYFHY